MLLVATLFTLATSSGADSLQAAKFLGLAGNSTPLETGRQWMVLPPETPLGDGVLLANGTERARLDSVGWKRFTAWRIDSLPGNTLEGSPRGLRLPTSSDWVSWIAPPSGGRLQFGWSANEAAASATWDDLEGEAIWLQSIGPWVSLGGGYSWEQQTPQWQMLEAVGHSGAAVAACLPLVCWEMRQKASPYPSAAIFEKDLDTIVVRKRPGALIQRLPTQGGTYWQQSFEAHLGLLHLKGTYAPDAWKGLLQQVSLEDVPAGVLRWSVSLAWTSDQAMTGFSLATAPWQIAGWNLGSRRQELSWEVARFDLLFARTDQARLALSTRLHFSDPLHAGVAK